MPSILAQSLRILIRTTYFPTLWVSRLMCMIGRWNRWDAVDEHVIVGAVPSASDLRRLREAGVRAVVNLCEEFSGRAGILARLQMVQLCLPTLDYFAPSDDDIRRGLALIFDQISRGHKTYVHCKAGRGRSATLVLCYLIVMYGLSPAQAYTRLRRARPHVSRGLAQRPVVSAIALAADDLRPVARLRAPNGAAPTTGSK